MLSVTVNVTTLLPLSAPVKLVLLSVKLAIPQLSLEPLFTIAVVNVAVPAPFKYKFKLLLNVTIGLMVSNTVTVETAVLKLPLASVTVKLTLFIPKLVQLKFDLEIVIELMPQLSDEELFNCVFVILAFPVPSK